MGGGWGWTRLDAWRAVDLVAYHLGTSRGNPYYRVACQLKLDPRIVRRSIKHADVKRLYAYFLEHSDIPPKDKVPYRKHYNPAGGWGGAVPDEYLPLLKELFDEDPSLFLSEAATLMRKRTGARYTWKQILRGVHKLGYSLKVLKHRAAAQDNIERARFYANHHERDPRTFVFVDESHLSRNNCRRRRGRSRRGRVATSRRFLAGPGYNLSLLCACNLDGFIIPACRALDHTGARSGEAVTDTTAIINWFVNDLLPHLNPYPLPNSHIILDNASVHHSDAIVNVLKAHGCRVSYLPPYSPDLK
jgi:hypothetical protein